MQPDYLDQFTFPSGLSTSYTGRGRSVDLMITTCLLDKLNSLSFIERIGVDVRNFTIMCKFVMHRFQSLFIIIGSSKRTVDDMI